MQPPPPWVLFTTYLTVMGAAYGCFLRAFATRKNTPVHKRWGLTGVGLDMAGTAVVLVVHRVLGWPLPHRDEALVLWHRGGAYATTAMVLLIAFTGWRRMPLHTRLWPVFLPLYGATLTLAVLGYWPW